MHANLKNSTTGVSAHRALLLKGKGFLTHNMRRNPKSGVFEDSVRRNYGNGTIEPGGGVLDFGLDGGVPPGPRDPNPCLEVKKVPMFRDFAQKMDPCLGIF